MANIWKATTVSACRALIMASIALCMGFLFYATPAEAANKTAGIADTAWQLPTETEKGLLDGIEEQVMAVNSRSDAGAAAARDELAAKIAKTLASNAAPAVKEFLCRQISTLATEKHVPVLASLLLAPPGGPEAEVADAARGALQVVSGPAADAALLDALGKTRGSVKLGIVESLGERRTSQAVGALAPLLNDADAAMASAAAAALGKIGGAEAEQKLSDVLATVQGPRRVPVADAYLKCADRRLKVGDLPPATATYSRLYVPTEALPVQEAALRGLVFSNPQKGIPLAVEALGNSDIRVQRVALQLIRGLPGSTGTTVITGQLSTTPPALQVFLLEALADRGDTSALPAVEKAVQSQNEPVRVAAVKALGVLGNESQVELLAEQVATGSGPVRQAARHSLDTLRGAAVNETMGKLITGAAPNLKAELTRSLEARKASGERPGIGGGEAGLSAQQLIQHPDYKWQQTDSTIALLNHDRTVWQFNYGKDMRKPNFHPVSLIDGTVLTCLSPRDHPWHMALWFSWDELNGVQYWEHDPKTGWPEGRTEVVEAKVIPNQDHSASILLTLTYHPTDGPSILTEKRKIAVSAPDKDGRYRIDWEGTFTAGKQDVLLEGGKIGGGYAGMAARISQTTKDWRLIDSEGRVDVPGEGLLAKNTHGQKARWMDFSVVDTATGDNGGIAILQHPSTFRYPTHWHNVIDDKFPFGYFNPAPLWAEPFTLQAGKSLKVSYRIVVHPGRGNKEQVDAEWNAFSGSKE